jgi:hypothetical protein
MYGELSAGCSLSISGLQPVSDSELEFLQEYAKDINKILAGINKISDM